MLVIAVIFAVTCLPGLLVTPEAEAAQHPLLAHILPNQREIASYAPDPADLRS